MRMRVLILIFLILLFVCNSCSVFIAARRKSIDDFYQCQTRKCLIDKGALLLDRKVISLGIIEEKYLMKIIPSQARKNLAMSISTLGLWEIGATPIVAMRKQGHYYTFTVKVDKNGNILSWSLPKRVKLTEAEEFKVEVEKKLEIKEKKE